MQPHIQRTIEDIELKIGFLQRVAEALRHFDSAAAVGAPFVSPPAAINGHTPPQAKLEGGRKNGQSKPLMRACKPARGAEESLRIAGIVKKLAEPFNTADVASKAVIEHKKASNWITVSVKKGWLVRASAGHYKRTPLFAGNNPGEQILADIHKEIESAKPKDS